MKNKLKILHLEDLPDDADLVRMRIKKAGLHCEIRLVDNRESFIQALNEFKPHIILSDHSLPSFDSHEALSIIKQWELNIPFILVTATVSEEYAVSIIKEGAADYILKDRLQRLPNAIEKAMEKQQTEIELANQLIIQQRLVTEASIQVQERERDQIGKELHDNINQILATAKLYVEMARAKNGTRPDLLEKTDETIKLAINEIRKLSHKLIVPTVGSSNLVKAVGNLISDLEAVTSLKFQFVVKDFNDEEYNKNINLMFYRIIQEQINNIIKHAAAENVTILLASSNNQLELTITDDGEGFDLTKTAGGVGLKNIRNRVEFYHGTTNIISSPGRGCRLEIKVPAMEELIIHA
jgi:signal transduction histidine kinase